MPLLSIISGALRAERFIQPECELIRRISRKSTTSSTEARKTSSFENNISYISFAVSNLSFIAIARLGTRGGKRKRIIKRDIHSALNGATIDALQKLNYDRMQETHVLGTAYRKTIHAEMTDHFRYVLERLAKLPQNVSVQFFILLNAHMHETAGAPEIITI